MMLNDEVDPAVPVPFVPEGTEVACIADGSQIGVRRGAPIA